MMGLGVLNRQGVLWLGFFALILLAWPRSLRTGRISGFFDAAMMPPTFVPPALRTFVNVNDNQAAVLF